MFIPGKWHPPDSSALYDATLCIEDENYILKLESEQNKFGSIKEISVSDRIGNAERKLIFKDGSTFSTIDNDSIDYCFKKSNWLSLIIHRMEQNLGWVVVSVFLTIFLGYAGFKWGVPWAGSAIAHALPEEVNKIIGANALEFLDEHFFSDDNLSAEEKEAIRNRFDQTLLPLLEEYSSIDFTLHFREWSLMGQPIANALALPSGEIILTERFVELAEEPGEIDAVIFHEMGHIVHRHSLEMIVESTLIATAIVLITGGIEAGGGLAELGVGVGSALVNASYSRDHESEADDFAFEYSFRANIDPILLSEILQRMEADIEKERVSEDDVNNPDEPGYDEDGEISEASIFENFSSHPTTIERTIKAKHFSHCFRKGITYEKCSELEILK